MDNTQTYQWYMVSTMSGKEQKVLESLNNRINSEEKLSEIIEEIHMFVEPRITKKELDKRERGEEFVTKYVNMYTGYIFIKMIMTDEAWFVIRNTQYVTGLIGSSGKGAKPTPVSPKQMAKMFDKERKVNNDFEAGNFPTQYLVGTIITVNEGPFEGQQAKIIECDSNTQKVIVEIEVFGRKTPYEFDFKQIDNIE